MPINRLTELQIRKAKCRLWEFQKEGRLNTIPQESLRLVWIMTRRNYIYNYHWSVWKTIRPVTLPFSKSSTAWLIPESWRRLIGICLTLPARTISISLRNCGELPTWLPRTVIAFCGSHTCGILKSPPAWSKKSTHDLSTKFCQCILRNGQS